MTRTWTTTLMGLVVAAAIGCGPAPDRDTTQDATGTTGKQAGEVTVTGCLALGQMGIYMLTPEGATGSESGVATTGYQLLGQPNDFNQYMNKRVRVTGTTSEAAQERPASNAPPSAHDKQPEAAPWPKLQVREVDPIGGDCK